MGNPGRTIRRTADKQPFSSRDDSVSTPQAAGSPPKDRRASPAEHGVVLLVTMVVLVVLAALAYTASSRVAALRHRNNYLIDYQSARYACDSALKSALAHLRDINELTLVERPNEPDFSDLFAMSEEKYQELIERWAAEQSVYEDSGYEDRRDANNLDSLDELDRRRAGPNEMSDAFDDMNRAADSNKPGRYRRDLADANKVTIRGPYGPAWPFVAEPQKFEIGSATVTIEIEDENAKYPLGWTVLEDTKLEREARASFETFCEWMGLLSREISALEDETKQLAEIKTFKVDFQPITTRTAESTPAAATAAGARRPARTTRARYRTETLAPAVQFANQTRDFAKLFHTAIIDTETLARPTIESETRKESALKYVDMWGSAKVNVNTAPRHVLEAAFAFGGNGRRIAEDIIQKRRVKPFKDIEELKRELFSYSDSISKCEKFITTVSECLVIRVTAQSGVAKASASAAILRTQGNFESISVVMD